MDVVDAVTGPTAKHRRFVLSVLVGGGGQQNKSELTGKGGLDFRCSRPSLVGVNRLTRDAPKLPGDFHRRTSVRWQMHFGFPICAHWRVRD